MIKITYDDDNIHITGHSLPDICAAISSTTITTANILLNLQTSGIDDGKCIIEDNLEDDYMHFKIEKHSKITDTVIATMIVALQDVVESFPKYVQIKKESD